MSNVSPSAFDPHLAGGTMDDLHPDSHAARCGVTCRDCGQGWPCQDNNPSADEHRPSLVPVGAPVWTEQDLDRLIWWAPGGRCPVVLDRYATPWILYCTEDGDTYAVTVECPDNGAPGRYDLAGLLASRGPLRVLFNGDTEDGAELVGRQVEA
ncbi:hypothetical protein [Kribbella sp. CA-294648]|uniref:hypothetical protein n=1 Tax=Kribbella sp. CA-294648 TaxID=3239948 RepID=UPI003D944AF1